MGRPVGSQPGLSALRGVGLLAMTPVSRLLATSIFGGPHAVPWEQVADLFAAVALCGLIGLEREVRRKSAGLRTHSTVGLAAALIMVVSKYGFGDVIGPGVTLDPSRVAAQIVTGIGFVGAGLIFVRQDAVRGLTTAASVWLSAAVGMACGAHLVAIAAIGTAAYLLLSVVLFAAEARLPAPHEQLVRVSVEYLSGQGALREIMRCCVDHDLVIVDVRTRPTDTVAAPEPDSEAGGGPAPQPLVHLDVGLRGATTIGPLLVDLAHIGGVVGATSPGGNDD